MSRDERMYLEHRKKESERKNKEKGIFCTIPVGNTGREVKEYYNKFGHC